LRDETLCVAPVGSKDAADPVSVPEEFQNASVPAERLAPHDPEVEKPDEQLKMLCAPAIEGIAATVKRIKINFFIKAGPLSQR